MLKKQDDAENRRKHPRVSTDIEIKIADILFQGDDTFRIGKAKNLSCSGMYCSVNKHIHLLTKVEGVLKLPFNDTSSDISFQGIVVRVDPEKETEGCDNYNIAIFFNSMGKEDKKTIQNYLHQVHP